MDTQLRALIDPTRRKILRQLAAGEKSAGGIAGQFDVTAPAISHHLKVLSEAGLVIVRRDAQSRMYSLDTRAIEELRERFNRFWDDALPRLKSIVESDYLKKRSDKK